MGASWPHFPICQMGRRWECESSARHWGHGRDRHRQGLCCVVLTAGLAHCPGKDHPWALRADLHRLTVREDCMVWGGGRVPLKVLAQDWDPEASLAPSNRLATQRSLSPRPGLCHKKQRSLGQWWVLPTWDGETQGGPPSPTCPTPSKHQTQRLPAPRSPHAPPSPWAQVSLPRWPCLDSLLHPSLPIPGSALFPRNYITDLCPCRWHLTPTRINFHLSTVVASAH